jgi:outer membrane protein TolC
VRRRLAAALLAVALVPACAIDEAADVAAYQGALDSAPSTEPAALPAGAPLDLRTAMRLANARDEALAQRGEDYVRVVVERQRALARILPTLTLSPSAAVFDGDASVELRGAGSIGVNPAADPPEIARAAWNARSRRALLLEAQDDLLLDVARVHFLVLNAERRAEVLRASLVIQEARVEDARARVVAGLQRPVDVALAESRAADARVQLVDAEVDARNAREALSFLTGWDLSERPLDEAHEVPAELGDTDEMFIAAVGSRAAVRAADLQVAAAHARVESAYGEWWPSVALDVAAFASSDAEPDAVSWTTLLRVDIPIFSAGLIEAGIRDALSLLRAATLEQTRVRRAIARDVATARETVLAVGRRLTALEVRADAARRALELAEGQWSAGLGTNLERLVAQDEVLTAELGMATAALERQLRHLELLRAMGMLHEVAGIPRVLDTDDAASR